MNSYWNKLGLLNASNKTNGVDENSPLYAYEYLLLNKNPEDQKDIEAKLLLFINNCRIKKGLYNQRIENTGSNEDYMSHDQLTTIMNFSYKHNFSIHKDIWEEIKRQGYKYDNMNPDKPESYLHPRDLIYYAYLNKHWIGYVFFPFLLLIMIQSMVSKVKVRPTLWDRIKTRIKDGYWAEKRVFFKTDGKLLTFTRLYSCDRMLMKISKLILEYCLRKLYGSWANLFNVYFDNEHPNVIEARRNFNA